MSIEEMKNEAKALWARLQQLAADRRPSGHKMEATHAGAAIEVNEHARLQIYRPSDITND